MNSGLDTNIYYLWELRKKIISFARTAADTAGSRIPDITEHLCRREVCFVNGWDMEPCDEYFKIPFGWNKTPNQDEEWVYSLNRMEYLRPLIYAYAENGNAQYIKIWKSLVSERYENCRKYKEIQSKPGRFLVRVLKKTAGIKRIPPNRTLDTAIRLSALSADMLLWKALGVDVSETVYPLITSDLITLESAHTDFGYTGNWDAIILSSVVICRCILYGNDKVKRSVTEEKLKDLAAAAALQISDSGVHTESSLMYHAQVLIWLCKAIYYAEISRLEIPDTLTETAEKMFRFLVHVTPEDNRLICFGDSDRTDISALLWLCGQIFDLSGSPEIKKRFRDQDPDDYALCGDIIPDLIEKKVFHPDPKPDFCSGGVITFGIRSDFFAAGFNTRHTGGHSHGDMGEVIMYYKGIPLFTDGGRFTYREIKYRTMLKTPQFHSCLVVDNGKDYRFKGTWKCGKMPAEQKSGLTEKGDTAFTAMAYTSKIKGVSAEILRIIGMMKTGMMIIDIVRTPAPVMIQQNYLIDPAFTAEIDKDRICFRNANNQTTMTGSECFRSEDIKISMQYGKLTSARRIYAEREMRDFGCIAAVIGDPDCRSVNCMTTGDETVIRIKHGEQEAGSIRISLKGNRVRVVSGDSVYHIDLIPLR